MFVGKPITYGLHTENGATLQELQEKWPISEKKMRKLLLEIKKMKVKNQKISENCSSRRIRGHSTIRAGRARAVPVEEMY